MVDFSVTLGFVTFLMPASTIAAHEKQFSFEHTAFSRMAWLGEVGEFGLNHIPAKNAACESGPEGSNPSLSAITTERSALGVVVN